MKTKEQFNNAFMAWHKSDISEYPAEIIYYIALYMLPTRSQITAVDAFQHVISQPIKISPYDDLIAYINLKNHLP